MEKTHNIHTTKFVLVDSSKDNYDGDKGYKNHQNNCIPGSWRNVTDI